MQGRKFNPLVFVVDDDSIIVRTLVGLLTRAGFRTASAMNVAGALRGIREQRPDLILLDINLPDGSGFDVCLALHSEALAFDVPILFISASEDVATKVAGFDVGGVDYITKPIIGAEVIARVRTHLRLRQVHQQLAELQAERIQQLADAQHDLMPRAEDFPEARFEVSIRQVLTAGGDFYDVFPAGEGIVDYLVADASGHNFAASLWTASLKALVNEYAGPLSPPIEIVCAINASLCRILPPGAFFTMLYARLNHHTGRLTVVNAGHPPAIVVHLDKLEPLILEQEGDVVGVFVDAEYGVTDLTMQSGDRMFLYTDGLIESAGSYAERLHCLANAFCSRRAFLLRDVVPAVVDEMMAGLCPTDDTLLVGVEL